MSKNAKPARVPKSKPGPRPGSGGRPRKAPGESSAGVAIACRIRPEALAVIRATGLKTGAAINLIAKTYGEIKAPGAKIAPDLHRS